MSALPDGFWGLPPAKPAKPAKFHFFFEGDQRSLCGAVDADEITGDPERRRPGGMDCKTCEEIYAELRAPVPPPEPSPDWTVKTDPVQGHHTLFYQGKPQSTVRGPGGLATQNELAAIFNRNGTLPKKSKKVRCAADAPDPSKYLTKSAAKTTPELPSINTMSATPRALTPAPVQNATPFVETIPASQFRRYPSNRKITPEQIAKMSDSIRTVGVLQPITARQVENPETGGIDIEIVIGESRWLGCCDIDPEYPVPCIIRELSDKDAAMIHAIENFQRKDLDAVEEAYELKNLLDQGWKQTAIAHKMGRTEQQVSEKLLILQLAPPALEAIKSEILSLRTAVKMTLVHEDQREAALEAIISPIHSTKALSTEAALKLLDEKFIEPLKRATEWETRRSVILENHPGAKWLDYAAAKKLDSYKSGYIRADKKPDYMHLSDAARAEELVVPTWGELAQKHGAPLVIGCDYNDEAHTYVDPYPLIDGEKAACTENPADCIFIHEGAVQQARLAAEHRKQERADYQRALAAERMRIVQLILAPEGINKTATRRLIDNSFLDASAQYHSTEHFAEIFEIPRDHEDQEQATDDALSKYLRSKTLPPFEAMGRLTLACYFANLHEFPLAEKIFEAGAVKPADFPHLAKIHTDQVAAAVARAQQASENENEAAA